MTPTPTDQGGIPWSAIIIALITLGTFFTHQPPLQGVRPDPREHPHGPPISAETVPARLWQDPFEAVDLHAKAPAPHAGWFPPAERHGASKPFSELCSSPIHTSQSTRERDILAVMVPGGPFPEEAESRIRWRYGVLSGLAMEGYQPADEDHIGRVTVAMGSGQGQGNELVVPYECFGAGDPERALVLLWLRGETFGRTPLTRLDALLDALLEGLEPPQSWRFTLLGPNRSSILSAMAQEAAEQASPAKSSKLRGGRILSFAATADERYLLPSSETHQTLEGLLSDAYGIEFRRTIATDGDLGCLLARELILRGVSPLDDEDLPANAPRRIRSGDRYTVLIGEWDSLYARRLREDLKTKLCLGKGEPCTDRVLGYGYLRGIDGKIVAPPKAGATNNGEPLPSKPRRSSVARPAGPGQYDYLHRLAGTLNAMNQVMRKDGGRISAVGVIGTDVYDKLLVLQALEPRLPGALFFSTDLSADLAHAEELRWSRNLVVASGFGLRLSDDLQGEILPFRNSYQTSAFLATRLALGERPLENGKRPAPRLFEIGRYGPIQLKQVAAAGANDGSAGYATGTTTNWMGPRTMESDDRNPIQPTTPIPPLLSLDWSRLTWALAAAFLLVIVYWEKPRKAIRSIFTDRYSPGSVSRWGYVRDALFVLVTAILVIALIRAAGALGAAVTSGVEPLYLTAGVSIWPSELIRLLAIGFALHYLYRCHVAVPRDLDRLEGRLFAIRHRWRALPMILSHERLDIREGDSGTREADVPLGRLWWRYRRLGSARHMARWLRILLPAGIVVAFINRPLIEVLGIPAVPARGAAAFAWDFGILIAAIAVLLILVFSVLDTIRLTSRLIGLLAKHRIDWPQRAVESFLGDGTVADDTPEGLGDPYREWLGVQLVGELTAIVGKLVYFPFLVVFLMVASRLSFFDRWDYPLGLVIVILLTLAWAVVSALKLRRSAEKVRDLTVRKIDRHIARLLHKETREDAPVDGSCRHFPHLARDSGHSDRSGCDLLKQAQRQNREEHLRYLRVRILDYRVGAFSSFLRQPLVQTLMVVISGLVIYLVDLAGV